MSAEFGPERLVADLKKLGYDADVVRAGDGNFYALMRGFEVALGRFAGRVIDLAVMALPDYPRTVAAAIHVRATPQLLEKSDTAPGVRNIIDSPLGADWRYWSKNLNWTGERDTRRLISQINGIFANA